MGNRLSPRNPLHWKVDSIGQQLPYVDYYEVILLGSREILEAKAISGEYNMGGAWADLASFPLLVENADKAGYTVRMFPGLLWGGSVSWAYNYTSKDPVLREIFNDLRFRRALSHAINREEFGEVFNLGLTEPRQAAPPADWSFYDESFGRKYLEYGLDLANQLLDETGLEWNADRTHRHAPRRQAADPANRDRPGGAPPRRVGVHRPLLVQDRRGSEVQAGGPGAVHPAPAGQRPRHRHLGRRRTAGVGEPRRLPDPPGAAVALAHLLRARRHPLV